MSIRTTVPSLAKLLGVTPRYIRIEIEAGRLQATKFGRDWVIAEEAVKTWKANRPLKRGPKVHGEGTSSR